MRVTLAPGTTPPWLSFTVPDTLPDTCAEAEAGMVRSKSPMKVPTTILLAVRGMTCPLPRETGSHFQARCVPAAPTGHASRTSRGRPDLYVDLRGLERDDSTGDRGRPRL